MARIFLHPMLRWLLLLTLWLWVVLVTRNYDHRDRGVLPDIAAQWISSYGRTRSLINYGFITFALDYNKEAGEFRVDVVEEHMIGHGIREEYLVAALTYSASTPTQRGLIYTPYRNQTKQINIAWTYQIFTNDTYTAQDLEAALAPYRELYWSQNLNDSDIAMLESKNLLRTPIIRDNLPVDLGKASMSWLDPSHLFGELAFYLTFVWWLLTLIYARKLWPRYDPTRCPKCRYTLQGLTTPTCPECGQALPPPPPVGELPSESEAEGV